MNKKEYKQLDGSIASFELLKERSESYWKHISLVEGWGFQIQPNSKWKKGLTEAELEDFQQQLNITFPEVLKNFYRTMNGLDKPGLNNNGEFFGNIEYDTTFYSYPEDIEAINSQIEWVMESNNVSAEMLATENIPAIFPYYGHRCLILDESEIVLSMYGDDIIVWDYNLPAALAQDIFPGYFKSRKKEIDMNSFWNKKIG